LRNKAINREEKRLEAEKKRSQEFKEAEARQFREHVVQSSPFISAVI